MNRDHYSERREVEQDLWELEKRQKIRSRLEYILKIYIIFGALLALAGGVLFLFLTLNIQLSWSQQIALLTAGTGVVAAIGSWLLLQIQHNRLKREATAINRHMEAAEFVMKWSTFELKAKETLIQLGRDFNKYSIREVIEGLFGLDVIDQEDVLTLDEAINLRNMAVHGGRPIPSETLHRFSERLDKILAKLPPGSRKTLT